MASRLFPRLLGVLLGALAGLSEAALADERPAAAPAGYPVATESRLGGDAQRTRFILDLSRAVELTAFTLADPYRVVIDLPQVVFQLPAKTGESGRGLIKAFRYGLVMQGASRVVIDTKGPVSIERAFVNEPLDGEPARLVLDLVPIDRETFRRKLAIETRPAREGQRRAERQPAAHAPQPPGDARPLIVIDPGHGGLDTGTVAQSGEAEKAIVLEFAQQLRDKIEQGGKYRVMLTRNDDRFISLADRVRFARSGQAALFVSIHADALETRDDDTRGATVYTLSETASDGEAARLAEAENRADVIAGVDLAAEPEDVADILIDLAQRETKTFSHQFARTLVGELRGAARLHKNPLRSAGFRVLRAPDVPSVLVELGYVSSKSDLKLLTSESWRSRATESIARAVDRFFMTRLAGSEPARGSN